MISGVKSIPAASKGGVEQIEYLLDVEYLADSESSGMEWFGEGAKELGLEGAITNTDAVRKLALGFDPETGEALVERAGADHKIGSDFSFTCGKTVSSLAAVGTDEVRAKIIAAHDEAVRAAMRYAQAELIKARMGHNGTEKALAKIVAGLFRHDESRELDPHIHTHVLLLNLAKREGGKREWGAIDNDILVKAKATLGQVYQNALAQNLQQAGFPIEFKEHKTGKSVEIAGVPQELCDAFSKRTKQIEQYIKEHKLTNNSANQAIAWAETRQKKDKSFNLADYKNVWKKEASDIGWTAERLKKEVAKAAIKQKPEQVSDDWIKIEATRNFEEAVFKNYGSKATLENLYLSVLEVSAGHRTPEQARALTDEITRGPDVFFLDTQKNGQRRVSTKALVRTEHHILAYASSKHESFKVDSAEEKLRAAEKSVHKKLNDGQLNAARHILESNAGIDVVEGVAGGGKTTMLKVATEVWKKEGRKVYGTAIASVAASGLDDAKMNQSMNTTRILLQIAKGKISLEKNDVVVIDEAAMLDTKQCGMIVEKAKEAEAKVVFVGDYEQLQAIGAGGIHKYIYEKLGGVALTEAVRQQDKQESDAALAIAAGTPEQAIALYKEKGQYLVEESKAAINRKIAQNMFNSSTNYARKFAVCETRAQGRDIADQVKEKRIEAGELERGHDILCVEKEGTREQAEYTQNFSVGDRILFTKNSNSDNKIVNQKTGKHAAIENGRFATIEKIKPLGNDVFEITAAIDKGKTVVFRSDDYKSMTLGYAGTIHKSQGATFAECHWTTTNPNKFSGYVAASRHTDAGGLFIYTTAEADETFTERLKIADYNETVSEILERVEKQSRKPEPTVEQPALAAILAEKKAEARSKPESDLAEVEPARPTLSEQTRRLLEKGREAVKHAGNHAIEALQAAITPEPMPTPAPAMQTQPAAVKPVPPPNSPLGWWSETRETMKIDDFEDARYSARFDKMLKHLEDGRMPPYDAAITGWGQSGKQTFWQFAVENIAVATIAENIAPKLDAKKQAWHCANLINAAIHANRPAIVGAVCDAGFDVNFPMTTKNGTPLHIAAVNGKQDCIVELLKRRADIEARNDEGNTPLMLATMNRKHEAMKKLIAAGADIDAPNRHGETPREEARSNNDLKKIDEAEASRRKPQKTRRQEQEHGLHQ